MVFPWVQLVVIMFCHEETLDFGLQLQKTVNNLLMKITPNLGSKFFNEFLNNDFCFFFFLYMDCFSKM